LTWWRVSAASTPRWRRAASTSSASGREPGNCYTRHLERDDLAERLSSGWGSVLKPSACYGLLCFGPSRGRNVTFVSPRDWITGAWQQPGGDTAMRTVLRRFLDGYGPTTADDFSVGGVEPRGQEGPRHDHGRAVLANEAAGAPGAFRGRQRL
jgi:hypothetical protein